VIVVELAYSLCGDDVISLCAVKLGDTLNDHVVALSCSACKNDVLGLSTNDTGDCLGVIPRNISTFRCLRRIRKIRSPLVLHLLQPLLPSHTHGFWNEDCRTDS
jgi:hypothetical protein